MNKQIRALQQRKAKNVDEMKKLSDAAAARPDGLMTAEEQAAFDKCAADNVSIGAQITREQQLVEASQQLGAVEIDEATVIEGGVPAVAKDPKRGFKSFAHFATTVKAEGPNLSNPKDERLRIGAAAPTTAGNELSGADGGFLVPPEFSSEIFQHAFNEDSLLPKTDVLEITKNSMSFPKDESVPWGTDGVRAFWQAEAALGNATKPKISMTDLRLYKLMALVPISDELLEDQVALQGYLPRKVGASIRWKANEAILFGNGVGQPLGAFNSNAVVTVVKESSQATLTLLFQNIAKMIARLPEGSFARAEWWTNNDVLPAIMGLNNTSPTAGATGTYPIWIPPQTGVQNISPYGNLMARPVNVTQHAKSFTAQGDLLLADPFYIRAITKGGIRTDMSLHLYFDADAAAFRTTFRLDAQPKIVNPIAPFNGSNNLSPFVQLGAR